MNSVKIIGELKKKHKVIVINHLLHSGNCKYAYENVKCSHRSHCKEQLHYTNAPNEEISLNSNFK